MADQSPDAAPRAGWNWRPAAQALFCTGGLALLVVLYALPPLISCDCFEYYAVTQAWLDHGSPQPRAEDLKQLAPLLRANGIANGPSLPSQAGVFPGPGGVSFLSHFWLYPMSVVPVRACLRWCGGNELSAHAVANGLFFLAALYVILFHAAGTWRTRLVFAGLAAVSPVAWYLRCASTEPFTWSLAAMGLAFLGSRKYARGALCAGLGATQNPPVLFLGFLIALASLRERSLRRTALALACASVCFVPGLYSYFAYGCFNPILAIHGADRVNVSLARTWSFLTDLNQGVLPYMPLLLVLAALAGVRALASRNLLGLGLAAVLGLMILACETTVNWNSGCIRLLRYAVWTIPVFAWLAAEFLPRGKSFTLLAGTAVAVQAAVLLTADPLGYYLVESPLAKYALTYYPRLYSPDPEIFADRQCGCDFCYIVGGWLPFGECLPIPFATPEGRVTKVLANAASLARLPQEFRVDPRYLGHLQRKFQGRKGLFYLTPPEGKLWTKSPGEFAAEFFRVKLGVVNLPRRITSPTFTLPVTLSNEGNCTFQGSIGQPGGGRILQGTDYPPQLKLSYQLLREGKIVTAKGNRFLVPKDRFRPGDTVAVPVQVQLPNGAGPVEVEVIPLLESLCWGERSAVKVRVNVRDASPGHFDAEVVSP